MMSAFRIIPLTVALLPLLAACAGTPDPTSTSQEADKAGLVVGSHIPTKTVPIDVSTAPPESIDRARKNSLVGPPR